MIGAGFWKSYSHMSPIAGAPECCVTDAKAPFSLGLSSQPRNAPLSGSC